MKAILVDDEPDGIRTLQKLLELHCPQVNVIATCSGAMIAKQQILQTEPDVVFWISKCRAKADSSCLPNYRQKILK